MKALLEKLSLLSLSLMLVSTFLTSTALPQMISTFQQRGYAASQVGMLFSISSFAIMEMLVVNPFLDRFLPERSSIILGLSFIAFGGSLPAVGRTYTLVVVSRVLLGMGTGLISARAISIISKNYQGNERAQMLGFRGSFGVLGNAFLAALVGFSVPFGWSWALIAYLLALPILLSYLLFAPKRAVVAEVASQKTSAKLTKKDIVYIVGLSLLAGFVININSASSLRIPVIVDQLHLGNPRQASLILSGMMLMGILPGICSESLLARFRKQLIIISLIPFALGPFMLGVAHNLWLVLIGAMLSGFWYSIVVTSIFGNVSNKVSPQLIGHATTLILLFCSFDGASAAIVLNLFSKINPQPGFAFVVYAITSLIISLVLMFKTRFLSQK